MDRLAFADEQLQHVGVVQFAGSVFVAFDRGDEVFQLLERQVGEVGDVLVADGPYFGEGHKHDATERPQSKQGVAFRSSSWDTLLPDLN